MKSIDDASVEEWREAAKQPELTPWFPEGVEPVHVGVYDTRFDGLTGYCLWDGYCWHNQRKTIVDAATDAGRGWQHKEWRGLARESK